MAEPKQVCISKRQAAALLWAVDYALPAAQKKLKNAEPEGNGELLHWAERVHKLLEVRERLQDLLRGVGHE